MGPVTILVPRRAATSARLLVDFARECGLETESVLRGTGVPAEELTDPRSEITDAQELALIRNLVAALHDEPGRGFSLGTSYQAAVHGIYGYALMSCATVREGIEVGTRYFDLSYAFSRATLAYTDGEVRFSLDDRDVPLDVRGFLLERDLSGILAHWTALWGSPTEVRRIEVDESLFDRIAPMVRERGYEVVAVSGPHTVVVDSAAVERPMPTASAAASALLLEECAELLQRRRFRSGTAFRVREILLRAASSGATQQRVAGELGLSVRTLRRRLGEEGTSYREVLAETYSAVAEELLAAGLSVERVALRLGYSDASSFTVAFTRWTGTTPGRRARGVRR